MKCGKSEFQGIVDVNVSAADILDVNSTGLVFAVGKAIVDNDGDTKIYLEKTSDEDIIRFDTGGSERANLSSNGLTLASGTSVNEFSIDGTLVGNSDDAVPTEKAVKTYVDGEIGGTGPSNVLFTFGGNDNANGDRGFYQGTSQTPQPATGDFAMWWTEAAGYQTVIPQFKWIKIAGVSTVKVYCKIWIHASFSTVAAQCQVDIGGQTGSVTGTNGQSTPEELNFTIDVSSLTNGTAYDVKLQLGHDDGSGDRDVYLSSIIAMAV